MESRTIPPYRPQPACQIRGYAHRSFRRWSPEMLPRQFEPTKDSPHAGSTSEAQHVRSPFTMSSVNHIQSLVSHMDSMSDCLPSTSPSEERCVHRDESVPKPLCVTEVQVDTFQLLKMCSNSHDHKYFSKNWEKMTPKNWPFS